MGCGQSKINLYPRKNKNGKGNSAKKSGAADKEGEDEEGAAAAAPPEDPDDDPDQGKHILPLVSTQPPVEVSASQQDFFKMLDEKIEKGKDYDSNSETEVKVEKERRKILIEQWRSASLSQSSQSQSSPPTPARRRGPRPPPPERQGSPASARRCHSYRPPHDMSPPLPRRSHSAQSHHQDPRQLNQDNWHDPTKSPVKRPQSAGANWKNNPKVAPYNQKPKKSENDQKAPSYKDTEMSGLAQDMSQITFNPTFQTHSPAHSAKQQPYIAQILSYPMSQQVTPPSPPKYIAPPEEYQDPQGNALEQKYPPKPTSSTQASPAPPPQPHIYYIHGNATATITSQDLAQQRQQTAIHLQQYVAMKQAQQQMFTYIQRGPHTVFPNMEYVQGPRVYEGEEFQYAGAGARAHSAPPVGVVRPMPAPAPPYTDARMVQMPLWAHAPPLGWAAGAPDVPYYPQAQFVPMYRPGSAGSAGTLTRYHKKDAEGEVKMCQSINVVRQKAVGQIVVGGGAELAVCRAASESPSPASVSTDSGLSPGNSAPSSKNSVFSGASAASDTYTDNKNKKTKSHATIRSLKNSKSLDS